MKEVDDEDDRHVRLSDVNGNAAFLAEGPGIGADPYGGIRPAD